MLCYLTALIASCVAIYFPAVLCVLNFVLGGLFSFRLFALKPSETPSGSVTSQKEHDEVSWCESVTHRRSKSLGCIYHPNVFTPLLKKKWHSC